MKIKMMSDGCGKDPSLIRSIDTNLNADQVEAIIDAAETVGPYSKSQAEMQEIISQMGFYYDKRARFVKLKEGHWIPLDEFLEASKETMKAR
jgi:hypothetical protein